MSNMNWMKLSAKKDQPPAQASAPVTPAPVLPPVPRTPTPVVVATAPRPSSDQRDRLFREAEDDRKQVYELTRRQQFHEFAIEVTQWTQTEDSRDEVVQKLMALVQMAFSKNQTEREAQFQETVARHDSHFQAREEKRNTAFKEGSDVRREAFQGSLDTHGKVIESLVTVHQQVFEQFRKHADCEKLVISFTERFEEMMKAEKSSLKLAQDAREDGQENLKLEAHSYEVPYPHTSPQKPINAISYPLYPAPQGPLPSPPISPPQPHQPSPSFVHHPSRIIPSGCVRPQPRPPASPPPQVVGAIRPLPHHPTDAVPSPPPIVSQSSTATSRPVPIFSPPITTTSSTMTGTGDPYEQPKTLDVAFQVLENARRSTFFEDQRRREDTFRQVKEYIKNSGERRETQLDEVQGYVDRTFLISQSQYNVTVRTQINLYDDAERYRDQAYEDTEAQMNLLFDDMLQLMEDQAAMLEDSKNQHERCYQKKIEILFSGMDNTVKRTRTSFDERFQDFLTSHHDSEPPAYLGGTPTPMQGDPYRAIDIRAPQLPGLTSPPPPFSPQFLLHTEASNMFSRSLPTAASVEQILKKQDPPKAQSQVPKPRIDSIHWSNNPPAGSSNSTPTPNFRHSQVFQDHFLEFAKSQEERATQFTTHLHTMHQEIAVLHLQSQLVFREHQALFEQRAASKWLEHSSIFQADQQRRGGELDRAESTRQDLFMSRQRARRQTFEAAQKKRRSKFEERYWALRKKLMEDETRRMVAFSEWKERMENEMERWMKYWKGMLALDERNRQDRYHGWMRKVKSGSPKPAWSSPRLEK